MSVHVASKRYAQGLGDALTDTAAVDAAVVQLGAFADAWEASSELRIVLESPAIAVEQRVAILEELCRALGTGREVSNALRLVLRRGRLWMVGSIASAFATLADERSNRTTAQVRTALPLSEEQREKLRAGLAGYAGKDVAMVETLDDVLGGGVVVEMDGKILDGSLRARLRQIKQAILDGGSGAANV